MSNVNEATKKKFKFPHVFVILLGMMLLALLCTYVIKSGVYQRVDGPDGRKIVDPTSFSFIDKKFLPITSFFLAIPNGFIQSALIIATVFIMGGAWEIINKTGAIAVGISKIAKALSGREFLVIPILMAIFCFVASLIGAAELSLVYLPAIMPLMLALGFDTMTAAGTVLLGISAGFSGAVSNPFSVGIGQQIAGLPMYSGFSYRLIVTIVFYIISVALVILYAKRVKSNPKNSFVYDESEAFKKTVDLDVHLVKFETKHSLIGILLIAALGLMLYGVLKKGWFMAEIGAIFAALGIASAIIGRLSLDDACNAFTNGAKTVMGAAIVIGLARSILIIIESGQIIDTLIMGMVQGLSFLPAQANAVGIFIVQSLFNFVVPSASGQFLITMPIFLPVGQLLGITQQTIVLASQMGDGITNMIYPVSGGMMACIAFAKIPYEKWVKFVWKYIALSTLAGAVFLIIAQAINYGPF